MRVNRTDVDGEILSDAQCACYKSRIAGQGDSCECVQWVNTPHGPKARPIAKPTADETSHADDDAVEKAKREMQERHENAWKTK